MRRAVAAAAAASLVLVGGATPASAQTSNTLQGRISKAIANTLAQNFYKRGVSPEEQASLQKKVYDWTRAAMGDLSALTTGAVYTPVSLGNPVSGSCNWDGRSLSCNNVALAGQWNNKLETGKTYRATFDVIKRAGVDLRIETAGFEQGIVGNTGSLPSDTNVTKEITFVAKGPHFGFSGNQALFSGAILDIKVELVTQEQAGGGAAAAALCAASPAIAWFKILDCGIAKGTPLGAKGYPGGGSFGGGGASGSWDCNDFNYRLDAQGNLIVPAMQLAFGGPVGNPVDQPAGVSLTGAGGASVCIFMNQYQTGGCGVSAGGLNFDKVWATSGETRGGLTPEMTQAAHRWIFHKAGTEMPERRDWVGALRQGSVGCTTWATIAYIRPDTGNIVPRYQYTLCSNGKGYAQQGEHNHRGCPENSTGAGDFDFYGQQMDDGGMHPHDCTWYFPRPDVTQTPDGYMINPETSIPIPDLADPSKAPAHFKNCPIDPELLRKLTQLAYDKAGGPPATISIDDVRPPTGTTIDDLRDPPPPGSEPPPPNKDEPPPPPPPGTPPPGGGGTTTPPPTCSSWFGDCSPAPPGGPPGIGAPPTGFLDPLFNWLPKFDGLTFASGSSMCPTWALNLTSFGGSGWQWLVDGHCTLLAYDAGHGSVASIIGALFIVLWGFLAGLILLRA